MEVANRILRIAALFLLVGFAEGEMTLSHGAGDDPVVGPTGTVATPGEGIQEGLVGRILGAGGEPIADAIIMPRGLGPDSPPVPEIAIVSDGNGRYEWPLSAGRYEVTVRAEGCAEATLQAEVEAGRVTPLDFRLERAP